jgi:hypothetical protein
MVGGGVAWSRGSVKECCSAGRGTAEQPAHQHEIHVATKQTRRVPVRVWGLGATGGRGGGFLGGGVSSKGCRTFAGDNASARHI